VAGGRGIRDRSDRSKTWIKVKNPNSGEGGYWRIASLRPPPGDQVGKAHTDGGSENRIWRPLIVDVVDQNRTDDQIAPPKSTTPFQKRTTVQIMIEINSVLARTDASSQLFIAHM
jgi:hypothetical protein